MEQTINADAARGMIDIITLINSIVARQRWSKSHSIRPTVITYVYGYTQMTKAQDVTAKLEKYRIKINCEQLQKFIKRIENHINLFYPNNPAFLYNINIGRAASNEVSDFLINIEKEGNNLRSFYF